MDIITKFKDLLIDSLKENKKMILVFYAIFFISFILSAALVGGHMENVIDDTPDSAGGSKDGNVTATELFLHNELGGIEVYIASILFGIPAIIAIIYNGVSLGLTGALLSHFMPKGWIQYIIYLIPHGIFEFTAMVIQSVAGILLFLFIVDFLKGLIRSEKNGFKEKVIFSYEENNKRFIQSLVLMIFCTILLLIAAPIEAYVSIPLSNFILGV
ncbi:stage II sporulation protein M [Methanobrevibacter sp.]|uniref:stage II sporulation protein M n=1 Tax=Methanobrevibacter sp. TaxID=66852 RepID=UPI0025D637BE|nr:stage II sporulation protein M [uncultured Methanobrevibacter sp.]